MRLVIGLLIAVLGAASQSSPPTDAGEVLALLSKVRLDKKQFYNIRDITIRRDVFSIALNRGTLAFLEPVMGRVTGAVFIGSGEVVAVPPDATEKQQIHKFTGSPVLNEPFTAALFRFTDDTYEEILKEHAQHAQEDVAEDDAAQFVPWDQTLGNRVGIVNYRILADFLEPAGRPLFLGELNGENKGWFDAVYDQRLVEEVALFKLHEITNSSVADLWASFNRRSETRSPEAVAHENKLPADVVSYDLDVTMPGSNRLVVQATMRLKGRTNGARVLSFDFPRILAVSSVSLDGGETVLFDQLPNALIVVLPRALPTGQEIALRFAYAGDVIENSALRGAWYPSLGSTDGAVFNLSLSHPPADALVWKSDGELFKPEFCFNTDAVTPENASLAYFSEVLGSYSRSPFTCEPESTATELERAQQTANRWFSPRMGWASYRDQWLPEGLARYLGAMQIDAKYPGMLKLREVLGDAQSRLAGKDDAGPVWLGQRLASTVTPDGYQILISKSPWIVHMLRMLMRDNGPNPDASFWKMTKEFLESQQGAVASAWDFKRVAEKYMTPEMDLRGDRKLDWFFDDWVFGTGIPTYSLDYKVQPSNEGFTIEGKIQQSGVGENFIMSVPVYADDRFLGRVVVGDEEGDFRFTVKNNPARVVVDPERTVLAKANAR